MNVHNNAFMFSNVTQNCTIFKLQFQHQFSKTRHNLSTTRYAVGIRFSEDQHSLNNGISWVIYGFCDLKEKNLQSYTMLSTIP